MWVGRIHSVEGLQRKKGKTSSEQEVLPRDCLQAQTATSILPWDLWHPALRILDLLASTIMSQFFKIFLSACAPPPNTHLHLKVLCLLHITPQEFCKLVTLAFGLLLILPIFSCCQSLVSLSLFWGGWLSS